VREMKFSCDRSSILLSAVRAALELLRDLLDGELRA
jgi:hypothetical protein